MQALFLVEAAEDSTGVTWSVGGAGEANSLLAEHHYLGPINTGGHELILIGSVGEMVVAAQVWRRPTSRRLPNDGTWLELSRWCLTPEAGSNAGSRQHAYSVRTIKRLLPDATSLVSYSDPAQGHTGALYRACNWEWWPTWMRLRPPPSGNGSWKPGQVEAVKDRWVFPMRRDPGRSEVLRIDDAAAIRHWRRHADGNEMRWARTHPQLKVSAA